MVFINRNGKLASELWLILPYNTDGSNKAAELGSRDGKAKVARNGRALLYLGESKGDP